jgi:hypothetical protein
VRIVSLKRPSSATTAPSPIKTNPPVSAPTPATINVVPSVNSLIGMPNPIAATPAAATAMPNSDKITDMFYAPPGPRHLRQQPWLLWLPKNLAAVTRQPQ